MERWAFVYTLSAGAEEVVRHHIGDDGCRLVAVGVPDVAQAVDVVEGLLAEGVQLIECCGAFGPAATAAVLEAVAGRVPVGVVAYPGSEAGGMHRLFG